MTDKTLRPELDILDFGGKSGDSRKPTAEEGRLLLTAFLKIEDAAMRAAVINLVEKIVVVPPRTLAGKIDFTRG